MRETANYIPILLALIFAVAIAAGMLLLARVIGTRRNPNPTKIMVYECGKDPIGSAHERISIKFYLVAMLFILFDIEAVFLIPWAVVYRDLGQAFSRWFVFGEMMVFIAVLLAGYLYVWRRGALDWNR